MAFSDSSSTSSASAAPTEAKLFEGGLPRACRSPQSGRFMNPWLTDEGKDPCQPPSASDVFRFLREWKGISLFTQPETSLAEGPIELMQVHAVDWVALRAAREKVEGSTLAVWLGHASVLCACSGKLVLCDPVFSSRCSPFSTVGPQRLVPCPVDPSLSDWPDDLAPDLITISHAHYDHLDEATVSTLHVRFPGAKWVAPLGLGPWFRKHGIELAAEMDWWQEDAGLLGPSLSLVCLPAQHWSNRWPWDRNKTLWCAYGLVDKDAEQQPDGRRCMPFFFAGDTGYCPVFKQLGQLFKVGLAAVPIGAYEPRNFLASQHCDPAEAVKIVSDLKADAGLAIHWGTFPLALEAPAVQLAELAAAVAGAADQRLRAVPPGGAVAVAARSPRRAAEAGGV